MKIIIDSSNLFAGGGVQVATSFLNDLNKINLDHEFHVLQSHGLKKQIDKSIFSSNFIFYELKANHSSILKRIKEVKLIESTLNPDVIFTVFGPSYHKSSCPKVVGFAIPHLIYKKSPFFNKMSIKNRLKNKISNIYKKYFFIKNSDALIFESDESRKVFMEFTDKKIKSYTVNNTLNEVFFNKKKWLDIPFKRTSKLNILCLSAKSPHKNLDIIPEVIDQLVDYYKITNFNFIISQNKDELGFNNKYDKFINYIGAVDINQVPSLYQKIDFLFMPTLLEVFSTTYLEAMYMGKPIIASDMGFARDICGNSALYNNPLDPLDYARSIDRLYKDKNLQIKLVENGKHNLKRFGNSLDRTKKYIKIIENIIKYEN